MTNARFRGHQPHRGRRTLRLRVTVEVQEEMLDEFLTHRAIEAPEILLEQPEFRGGWGALRHVHHLPLADDRIAVITTEAINMYDDLKGA